MIDEKDSIDDQQHNNKIKTNINEAKIKVYVKCFEMKDKAMLLQAKYKQNSSVEKGQRLCQ